MSLTVKICGLRDRSTLEAALEAGADMVGFVFFEASPRHLPLGPARTLAATVGRRARKVALTVDADDATLAAVIEALSPDILQLHGSETVDRVRFVRARFGIPVMRALAISGSADLCHVERFDEVCDYLLFDARAPSGSSRPGGNGSAFDWGLLRTCRPRHPWLLAGGLTDVNIGDAVRTSGARGIDVSSGVETAPGVKDPAAIARFIAASRAVSLDGKGDGSGGVN